MSEIKVTVRDKIATGDGSRIVCGNSDYIVRFDLDSEWEQLITRTMVVVNADRTYQEVVFTGDSVALPEIRDQSGISIGLYAGDIHTTTPAYFDCDKSARCGLGNREEPSEDVYNQLIELIDKIGSRNFVYNLLDGIAVGSLRGINSEAETDEYSLGKNATAFGVKTKTPGVGAFSAGQECIAAGWGSRANGVITEANGDMASSDGFATRANGSHSHSEGWGTIANGKNQHVQGKNNIEDNDDRYAHIVGNGETDFERSNAHTLDWDGNAWFRGDVYIGGESMEDAAAEKLARQSEIPAPYTLPTATADTLGGVKVGDGLEVVDGALRVKPEGDFALIETITIEDEGLRLIQRTAEPDGTEYNLSALFLLAITPTASASAALYTHINRKIFAIMHNAINTHERGGIGRTYACVKNGLLDGYAIGTSNQTTSAAPGVYVTHDFVPDGMQAINALQVNATGDIPVGTQIKIWGVRADA